jgi:hypothetical protein
VRLLIPAASTLDLANGLRLRVEGNYPYDGNIAIRVEQGVSSFALSLRIPGWCRRFTLAVNGRRVRAAAKNGFVTLKRGWRTGDIVELALDMPVEAIRAHANVADDAGRVALMRGPLVYALESVDNGPGLHRFEIDPAQKFLLAQAKGLPRGTVAICGEVRVWERLGDALYAAVAPRARRRSFMAIPYALWQNRGPAEMRVWLRERLPR